MGLPAVVDDKRTLPAAGSLNNAPQSSADNSTLPRPLFNSFPCACAGQVNLSGHTQEFPHLGFPIVEGDSASGKRGSLFVEFEVKFPPRLREAHLAALRVVLTETEIAILEDVLKLMSARKVRV